MDTSSAAGTPDRIFGFRDEHFFLSNFFVERGGLTGEHRFQVEKTFDQKSRHLILDAPTPAKAKYFGRSVDLRPDWEDVKIDVMRIMLAGKFADTRNPGLARKLVGTGDAELIEANDWGDLFWGVDEKSGEGRNELGLLLMELRARLRAELPTLEEEAPTANPGQLEALNEAVLEALTVKGFSRHPMEARAAAVVASILERWDDIVPRTAAPAPNDEPIAEAEPEAPDIPAEPAPEIEAAETAAEPESVEPVAEETSPEPESVPEQVPAEPEPEAVESAPRVVEVLPEPPAEVPAIAEAEPDPAPVESAPDLTGRIVVATDGSTAPTNPGPSGWAWYVSEDCWAAGAARNSTNNRAELAAMMNLFLATAETNPPLHILCDSQYVIGIMGGNNASANADLVEKLRAAMADRDYTVEWVKGHSGHPLNEAVDGKATAASAAVHAGELIPSGPGWTLAPEPAPVAVETPAPTPQPTRIEDIDLNNLPF